ncbi:MAG: flagellar hook-length control protein FliK [Spirochaetaceae bacterium]|nr:flagellar hook-length control protein FliK [Spirochaetaceae bacterium]
MFSVQMPVYSADNSFESDFSEIGRPVESGNYQDKGQFKNIFESVTLDYEDKMNMEKNIDKQVQEKNADNKISASGLKFESGDKVIKTSGKNLFHRNGKLISLKKGKAVKSDSSSKKGVKKISGSNDLLQGSQIAILTAKDKGIKKSALAASDNLSGPDIESQNTNVDSLPGLDSANNSKVALNTNTAVEFKGALFQITDSKMSKGSLKKAGFEKKTAGVKKAGRSNNTKPKLSVLDLRSNGARSNSLIKKTETSDFTSQKNQSDFLDQLHSENQDSSKPIVIELTHIKDNFSGESKTLTTSSGSALMKQLEESINSKIVKQSSVILKNSGATEIKLILKPEQLGKVRIKLNMQDNRISGNIIVDNASIKEIFENNLQNLERAFRENGFDTAALNVSVGGDHSGNGSREKENDITKQIELIDESIPTVYSESDNLIDFVV